jgi:hypothetical protein
VRLESYTQTHAALTMRSWSARGKKRRRPDWPLEAHEVRPLLQDRDDVESCTAVAEQWRLNLRDLFDWVQGWNQRKRLTLLGQLRVQARDRWRLSLEPGKIVVDQDYRQPHDIQTLYDLPLALHECLLEVSALPPVLISIVIDYTNLALLWPSPSRSSLPAPLPAPLPSPLPSTCGSRLALAIGTW